jgi:recombinational DNA repair ATPase RecF
MKLNDASTKPINVNKTRSIAGRVIKTIWDELDKMGATSPSDRRRYLDAILTSLSQRGLDMVDRELKKR